MLRSMQMMMVLAVLLIANAAIASDVPMPTEAEVMAAVTAGVEGKVCVPAPYGLPSREDVVVLDGIFDQPIWQKRVAGWVAAGFATLKNSADIIHGKPVMHLEYTKLGREAVADLSKACFATRKLTGLYSYTPPGQYYEYTVVHVGYWWVPNQTPAWASTLTKTDGYADLSDFATKPQWGAETLIYTNHGWTVEGTFGSPVQQRSNGK